LSYIRPEYKHRKSMSLLYKLSYLKYCLHKVDAIVQGFTCLATQTAQNLLLKGLEDYPTSTRRSDRRRQCGET
jgi:hypothetical protein